MKNSIKASVLIIMLLAACVFLSGCTTETPTATPTAEPTATAEPAGFTTLIPGVLSVATEAHYPPFENINTTTNDFEGFDIDLMNEIAKELGLEVQYTDHAFDTIITAVQAKKFDCAISAFTITGERQKMIDFTDWYYESKGQVISVKADDDSIKTAEDLVGKKVAVQLGTVGEMVTRNITGINQGDIQSYASMGEAFMALKKGEVVAVIGDHPVSYPYIKKYPGDYKFVDTPMSEVEYFGIVVNKDNPGLTAAINDAIAKIKADGRYDVMYDKWFAQ
ncbi:basic amino acid ABC transporter substrate-binding protein [Methanocella sp. CWC-04]|uniref:Basic amino acid ABC transporter substrate-binding protein n=1 Tax=Methanooceanicella nereidis TaxID=2052831 RepID=A0AAP2W768_9EURY|nr:basic amino acid ABC transporter substrate-binding protein [Methanocella sp. CWC-04]MCD1296082.1 basic amino acid ABC transporter substrate-binding protein [Methanocella sp. CWC-04]